MTEHPKDSSNPASDRRFMPRVRWEVEVDAEVGGQRVRCECVDISQTGLRLRGSWSAHRGQTVRVFLPLAGGLVETAGEVIWASNAPQAGWGLRFTAVNPVARRKIARFVIARLKERPQDEVRPSRAPATPARPGTPMRGAIPWASVRDIPLSRPDDPRTEISRSSAPPWHQPASAPVSETKLELDRGDDSDAVPKALPPDLTPWEQEKAPPPSAAARPCSPAMRQKLQELLDSGLASSSITAGAKEAMSARGDLFLRIDTGPVVVLAGHDPLAGRLRWLAAAVATWSGSDEPRLEHGPDVPLTIRI